jgi:glycosyltransferase involved in cell wall biosynthesis
MDRVCHLTTVHPRNDTRILYKECQSLAAHGYIVDLIVADGKGDDKSGEVKITDLGSPRNRLERLFFFRKKIFRKALEIDADLYHFHDPELIPVGVQLIKKGKRVVYDVHEDVPRQLLSKPYIPEKLRKPVSRFVERLENNAANKFTGIIAATPLIRDRFLVRNKNVIEVQNFPLLEEFIRKEDDRIWEKEKAVCYVGAISKVRGIFNMIRAMQYTGDTKLLLGGKFESDQLRDKCVGLDGWKNVDEMGFIDRGKVWDTLNRSIAGLVVLEPTINYLDSIPVKMFEYMAAGIPVIASDFPYWRSLLSETDCAIFVNPGDPKDIAGAINELTNNTHRASAMGKIGKKVVLTKFNWDQEKQKLVAFYSDILLKGK